MPNTLPRIFIPKIEIFDAVTLEIIRSVHKTATELGLKYFLAGALARDVLLRGLFGLRPGKRTKDIDFAFAVESWSQFRKLKQSLIDTGKFKPLENVEHRLWYFFSDQDHLSVDVIPFGGIEETANEVAWPPRGETVLNVFGFADALSSAIQVQIAEDLVIPVVSIPGLAVLKLFAWVDRRGETTKDAGDLYKILVDYADAGNQERLFTTDANLLEAAEFDIEIGGASLLGADVARFISSDTAERLRDLLGNETEVDRLIAGIISESSAIDTKRYGLIVTAFCKGFLSAGQQTN